VEKLIVVDITPRRYRPGHNDVFAALEAFDPTEVTDRKMAAELMSTYVSSPGIQLFLLKNLAREGSSFRWRMNLPAIKAAYDQIIGSVGLPGESYDGPTLFLRGGKSGYVQDDDLPLIELLFPRATLDTVDGAGHWVHAEKPVELMAVVSDFIGQ